MQRCFGNVWHVTVLVIVLTAGILLGAPGQAVSAEGLSSGATVYVPVYSHIPVGIKGISFDLAISLSIRNTDPHEFIAVDLVAYHDSNEIGRAHV